jgi:HK97 family phage major capsid protein
MSTAADLRATLDAKRAAAGAFLDAFKSEDGTYNMPTEKVGEFRKRNAELDDLQAEWEQAVEAEKAEAVEAVKAESQGRIIKDEAPVEQKDDRDLFTKGVEANAKALKALADGATGTVRFPIERKALMDITDITNENNFMGYEQSALYFGNVEPYFPHGVVNSNNVRGYIQSTDTDNAAFVANATAATDSAFVWTLTTDEVEDVQSWVPVARDILSDVPQLQSVVTGMLAKRLQKAVNAGILVGNGTSPNIWGVFTRTGVQTQAKGADPTMDAVHKAITKVRVTGDADPNLAVFHPNDWEAIRLTRTGEGVYILGAPTEAGPMRIWGIPVVVSSGMTENTAGVLDTSFTTIYEAGSPGVEVSTEHSTYFTERKLAIMVNRRLAAFHWRPNAACTVTGI